MMNSGRDTQFSRIWHRLLCILRYTTPPYRFPSTNKPCKFRFRPQWQSMDSRHPFSDRTPLHIFCTISPKYMPHIPACKLPYSTTTRIHSILRNKRPLSCNFLRRKCFRLRTGHKFVWMRNIRFASCPADIALWQTHPWNETPHSSLQIKKTISS